MMVDSESDVPRFRRVLVAFDAASDSRASIAEASALAALGRSELVGIFLADSEVERAMELPAARFVTPAGMRDVDPPSWRRSMRALVALRRRELGVCARQFELAWSFRVEEGRVSRILLTDHPDVGVVVVGSSRGREERARDGVVALVTRAEDAERVVAVARTFAAWLGVDLHVATTLTHLEAMDAPPHRVEAQPDEMARALRRLRPRLCVASCHPEAMDEVTLDGLRAGLDCPLALLR